MRPGIAFFVKHDAGAAFTDQVGGVFHGFYVIWWVYKVSNGVQGVQVPNRTRSQSLPMARPRLSHTGQCWRAWREI